LDEVESSQVMDWLYPVITKLACSTTYGSRAVQKVWGLLHDTARPRLLAALQPSIKTLCWDKHGHHCVIAMIRAMPADLLQHLIQALSDVDSKTLAFDRHGSQVLDNLISRCASDISEMVAPILADVERLSMHQYGNYVVQKLLEHGPASWCRNIASKLSSMVTKLATDHFGSHVLQKMLECCSPDDTSRIVEEFLKSSPERMCKNVYGRILMEGLEVSEWSEQVVAWRSKHSEQVVSLMSKHEQNPGACVAKTHGEAPSA